MFYSKNLKKQKKIKHCFFSRKNGFSKGVYNSLNCGMGSKDNKKNILKNLNFVTKKMNIKKNKLILMHQTHSNKIAVVKKENLNKKIIADAMITKIKGIFLGVLTADCVPIILYDEQFWNKIVDWDFMVERGVISKSDVDHFKFCNTVEESYEYLTKTISSTHLKGPNF